MTLVTDLRDSLVETLRERASQFPETLAYTFLKDGRFPTESVTLGQLDARARAIAAYLQAHCRVGDRVLLVYPQSIEAIAALLGCLYAGVVAVPAPAPETTRLKRVLPRLEAIAADAGARFVLATTRVLQPREGWQFAARSRVRKLNGNPCLFLHYVLAAGRMTEQVSHLGSLPWVATDKIPDRLATQWQPLTLRGDTLAYLQYTSGSTSTPKGVMLDNDNLMGHLAALQQAGGYDAQSVTVTWMPYFHDYGLVEGMLLPLFNGTPCYVMSPTAFIKRPLRWLAAISRYRATHSQAPNFAYAYCGRRIALEECADLDLSCWQAAGNAAEPINPDVIDEFCTAFAGCGFQQRAFAPAYGLAEATLVVTTSRKGEESVFCWLSEAALAQNRVQESADGRRWVSSGQVLPGTRVEIVNPETGQRCGADEVGEIWVASVGVARGYWQRPEETEATFGAVLADTRERSFLRTGDLGFLREGELFVTGRLKDLIIVRGENYYPQDIERVVEHSHRLLRPDAGAAFAVETDGEEKVVVVWECEAKTAAKLDAEAVLAAVRNTVAEEFELPVRAVVLLKRGSIFKTSSGKIQRRACRQGFLEGSLAELARWEMVRDEALAVDAVAVEENPLLVQVMELWREVLEVATVRETDNFFELGGGTLKATTLISEFKRRFQVNLTLSALVQAPTLQECVKFIRSQAAASKQSSSLIAIRPTGTKIPFFYVHGAGGSSLSAKQLIVPYLDPERPVYGLNAVGLEDEAEPHTKMDDMVQHYIRQIQTVHPNGPYLLGGQCLGGNVAFEMAHQLTQQGKTVLLVAMADSLNPIWTVEQKQHFRENWKTTARVEWQEKLKNKGADPLTIEKILKVQQSNYKILMDYSPQKYSGRVVYFSAEENWGLGLTQFDPMQPGGWNDWVEGGVEMVKVPGRHGKYHNPPHVEVYARKLNACLESADKSVPNVAIDENPLNVRITEIWRQVLEVATVWETDNFFELGGDSLKAMTVLAKLEQLGIALEPSAFAQAPTLAAFARLVHREIWDFSTSGSLVPIHPQGTKTPLFLIHHLRGDVFCPSFAQNLDPQRPLYGLRAIGFDGKQAPLTRIEDMAKHYIHEMQTVQPHGPYLLAGMCIGGNIALEMAQQLQRQGESVSLVVMIDSPNPCLTEQQRERYWQYWLTVGKQKTREQFLGYGLSPRKVETIVKVMEANHRGWIHQVPQRYSGGVVFFAGVENSAINPQHSFDPMQLGGWNEFVAGGLQVCPVPGDHRTMWSEAKLVRKLNACLESVDRAVSDVAVDENPLNVRIAEIWREVLGVVVVRETDNFFELGGDSLVPIHPEGTKTPLFLVHHIGGDVFCPLFAQNFDPQRPLYGLRAIGFDGTQAPLTCIEDMAAHYIREIQTVQPHGPYLLAGMCIGGNIALEMAQQLQRQGESVSLVVMIDSPNPCLTEQQRESRWQHWLTVGKQKREEQFLGYGLSPQKVEVIVKVMEANHRVWIHQVPQLYSGRVVFFSMMDNDLEGQHRQFDPMKSGGWNDWIEGGVEIVKVPGQHGTDHNPPHVRVYAQKLNACLESADRGSTNSSPSG